MDSFASPPEDATRPKLGSLAQAARTNQLKSARSILIAIGVLTLLVNGGLAIFARSLVDAQFDKEVQELNRKGMVIDPVKLADLKESSVRTTQLASVGFAALGGVFIAFGLLVYRYPVPITVSALALYLAGAAINAAFDPTTLVQGIILKIIVIVALAKAIKSAIAYQREQQLAAPEPAG